MKQPENTKPLAEKIGYLWSEKSQKWIVVKNLATSDSFWKRRKMSSFNHASIAVQRPKQQSIRFEENKKKKQRKILTTKFREDFTWCKTPPCESYFCILNPIAQNIHLWSQRQEDLQTPRVKMENKQKRENSQETNQNVLDVSTLI